MHSRLFYFAAAVVMALVGIAAAVALDRVEALASDLEEANADRVQVRAELDDQKAKLDDQKAKSQALSAQVERLGGKPVVDPGEPAAPIPGPAPSQAQVNTAVSVICGGSRSPCAPTDAQVKTTLRAICGGDCRGEDAKPPRDGDDGEDATAAQIDAAVARHCGGDGCRGPGPTDNQLDERIAAYCSQGTNCKGESIQGEKGATGSVTPGDYACPAGEYVTKISVTAEGSMVLACTAPPLLRQP